MEEPVRIRLLFEDRHLLTKAQRSEGLRRCWFLLPPELATVADLADHVARRFCLRSAPPDGLILLMDEFVLPSFESTCIFRDKDIVRVKKKACKKEVIEINGDAHCIQDLMTIDKQPILSSNDALAIKDFHEDVDRNRSINEDGVHKHRVLAFISEDTNSKGKRKHAEKPESSNRRKKLKLTSSENPNMHSKEKSSKEDTGLDTLDRSQINVVSKEPSNSVLEGEKSNQVEEKGQRKTCKPHITDDAEKLPSRSARRKKAKRQWKRELSSRQLEESLQSQDVENEVPCTSPDHQKVVQNTEMDEIVPVIIRPGHIRFEPVDEEQSNLQSTGSMGHEDKTMETFKWNGITSKKKGQKWGREKAMRGSNDDKAFDEWAIEKIVSEEGKPVHDHLEFESLSPLARQPKEGDVIVYRLVELSSTWCPELSPKRVGKVSSYDNVSMRIILVPVPEYPIFLEGKESTETTQQIEMSVYNEDGSLEIEYSSLVDVQLLKDANLESLTTSSHCSERNKEAAPLNNGEVALGKRSSKDNPKGAFSENNTIDPASVSTGNKSNIGWEQIYQALNEKKSELQENGCSQSPIKKSITTTSWSYRALRGSAIGPTLALLRGKNVENGQDSS
ncbi:coilin-like isoform X1 [Typha angustifolia]|uniref:coilin-like isoform X1 n=1 Tax=Typha angustifolia TaxID=59011 RepID=UPI003C2C6D13